MAWVSDANGNWFFEQLLTDSSNHTVIGETITVNGVVHADNTITTGAGNDTITTGAGRDTVNAGGGQNWIKTGDGNDTIRSGTGNDIIEAGDGNDTIYDLGGAANISAGKGDDVVYVTQSPFLQNIRGDAGNDLIVLTLTESPAYRLDLPTFVSGGDGTDTLSIVNNRLLGGLKNFSNTNGSISFIYSDPTTDKLCSITADGIERIKMGDSLFQTYAYFDFSNTGVIRQSYDLSLTLFGEKNIPFAFNKNTLFINDLFDGKNADQLIDKFIEKGYLDKQVSFKYGSVTRENSIKLIWSNILGSEPAVNNELYLSLLNSTQSIADIVKFANGYVNSTPVDLMGISGGTGYVTSLAFSMF
jgi:Ca2+-binding RTX toxin-like protein